MSSSFKNRKTEKEIVASKFNKLMRTVAKRCAFYRENPHRFARDYLNIQSLRIFQDILLYAMMHNYYFMYIASRSMGKTWLTALYCIIRCILYPGTKICVASGTKTQATEVLEKIRDDFCKNYGWGSNNLNNEITKIQIGQNESIIIFKNGSWIRTVASNDNARGKRANVLILDEFRMIDKNVFDLVLKRFLGTPRQPLFLKKDEYKGLTERNTQIFMSSAWKKNHWSYKKAKSFAYNMIVGKKYFVCGLPYQLSIYENLLKREDIEDEMSELDFNELSFRMEMEALFLGNIEGKFFSYDDVENRRILTKHIGQFKLDKDKKPILNQNERRILSVDVALMASKKNRNNDAAAIIINNAVPTSNKSYIANIVYIESAEGLNSDELGLKVMRLFYQYNCTDLVIDAGGNGMGVYDFLMKDQYDKETGLVYAGLSCCNDETMALRCKTQNAKKVIWSIKAGAAFNNEICLLLRNGFQKGKINLLVSEIQMENILKENGEYKKLNLESQHKAKEQYIQTSLLVNEIVHLNHELKGVNIKLKEDSGARKDRFSSLAYNFWSMIEIERRMKPEYNQDDIKNMFKIRTPKYLAN